MERLFEKAKRDVLDFLNTPYKDYVEKLDDQQPGIQFLHSSAIFDDFEKKIKNVIEKDPSRLKVGAINFLKFLLLNDKADDSRIPPIFEDVFVNFYDDSDTPTQKTYRSYLYEKIIKVLMKLKGSDAAVVECLKDIDSVVSVSLIEDLPHEKGRAYKMYKGKFNKDISPEQFDVLKQRRQKQIDEGDIVYREDAYEETDIANINDDNYRVYYDEAFEGEFYDEEEYTFPKKTAFRTWNKKQEVDPVVIDYIIESIRTAETDFRENIDLICEILNKDAARAGKKLMEFVQQEQNPVKKLIATKVLYRLEFGKVGMSETGLRYLDKQFDLGAYNNSENFAHRLTGDGKVGIFDKNKQALGYFQLHGLDSPEQKLKGDVLRFSYETLFHPKPGETSKERAEREKILEEFKQKYFDTYLRQEKEKGTGKSFYEETGVMFNNLSFPEQGWFLWSVSHASEADKKRAMEFIKKYREPGFKTFLSLEHGQEGGRDILTIGENLEQKTAEAVFQKYGRIVEATKSIGGYIEARFGKGKKYSQEDTDRIVDNLLKRGQNLLADTADEIEKGKVKGEIISEKLMEKLNCLHVDLLLFASAFKVFSKDKKEIKFSEIEGVELISKDANELGEPEKEEMRRIFIGNRKEEKEEFSAEYLEERSKQFDESDRKYYILKKDGKVVSFARFNELPNGNLYVSFINTVPEIKGHSIGTAFLKVVFDRETTSRDVELKVRVDNRVAKNYQTDFGFKIVGEPFVDKNGKKYFRMVREPLRARQEKAA